MATLQVTPLGILTTGMGLCLSTLAIYESGINIWYIYQRLQKARNSLFWKQMMVACISQVIGLIPMMIYGFLYTSYETVVIRLTTYGPWVLINGYFVYAVARVDQLMVIKRALDPSFSNGSKWRNITFWTIVSLAAISNISFIGNVASPWLSLATIFFNLNNVILILVHLLNMVACILYYREIVKFHAQKMGDDSITKLKGGEKALLLLPIVLEILNIIALPLSGVTKGQFVLGLFTSICTPTLDMAIMVRYLMVYTLSVLRNDGISTKGKVAVTVPNNNGNAAATLEEHEYQKPSVSQFANVSTF